MQNTATIEDIVITGLKNAPIWLLLIVWLYRDLRESLRKRIENTAKTAENSRMEYFVSTLGKLEKYLELLTERHSKEVSKEQVEVIVIVLFESTLLRIFKTIAQTIKENHLKANKEAIQDRLDMFFETQREDMFNKLNKFTYHGSSLITLIDDTGFMSMIRDTVYIHIFDKELDQNIHGQLLKILEGQMTNIRTKLFSKL